MSPATSNLRTSEGPFLLALPRLASSLDNATQWLNRLILNLTLMEVALETSGHSYVLKYGEQTPKEKRLAEQNIISLLFNSIEGNKRAEELVEDVLVEPTKFIKRIMENNKSGPIHKTIKLVGQFWRPQITNKNEGNDFVNDFVNDAEMILRKAKENLDETITAMVMVILSQANRVDRDFIKIFFCLAKNHFSIIDEIIDEIIALIFVCDFYLWPGLHSEHRGHEIQIVKA
ncbi:hypothetical protein V1514DRAFT_184923 [Lipomyces japonicus]|uniref:uncharacterized protein n=1 Tax=Lipomyces japonicus TaxID=56871 RepID=UPI0034CEBB19